MFADPPTSESSPPRVLLQQRENDEGVVHMLCVPPIYPYLQ